MSATPQYSPRPRDGPIRPQSRQSRPAASRTTTSRTPASVGQPLPRPHDPRTPHAPHSQQGTATPSPSYFGLKIDHSADCFSSSAAGHARANFSPPTSNVRSIAAASPRIIPLDQNPEYEAFRRQSESNRFSLGGFSMNGAVLPSPRSASHGGVDTDRAIASPRPAPPMSPTKAAARPASGLSPGSNRLSRSPKRTLSSDLSVFPDRPKRNSPASIGDNDLPTISHHLASLAHDRNSTPSLPPAKSSHGLVQPAHRAETLPAKLDGESCSGVPVIVTPQHVVNLLDSLGEDILLLDLRVSTQYARSKIVGALNLCIPTTLLKRASFNVQKLAETFKDEDQKRKFESWRSCKYIIVYDADSTQLKDAMACVNTLRKFANEGWKGLSYIIWGGFNSFAKSFPGYVCRDRRSSSTSSGVSVESSSGPAVAPVCGGCPMPASENAANPFFGNIRQNMDLIGGVGQMTIKHPASMTEEVEEDLPAWLRRAVHERDRGKVVSDKFLRIEQREQKRMREALSGNVTYGTPNPAAAKCLQIAGIEKGAKNRYNNIWPYEHTRVKLQDVADGGCDYINANYVKPAWSNKRYIATQGPIPATFADFWKVVWQQDVRVIVMLTAEKEGGQIKAHNYWEAKRYGHLQLNFLSEHRASLEPAKIHRHHSKDRPSAGRRRSTNPHSSSRVPQKDVPSPSPSSEQPYVIVRKFTLSDLDNPFERMREITQLQYSSWPDFGAPAHPKHLLGLIEQCNAVVKSTYGGNRSSPEPPNPRPVLVHCSAGCGRTGTFCTVDSVIDMLKRQRRSRAVRQGTPMDVDSGHGGPGGFFAESDRVDGSWVNRDDQDLVEKTVEDLRLQRLSMVQSLRQFVLCYESVLEWLVQQHPGPRTA